MAAAETTVHPNVYALVHIKGGPFQLRHKPLVGDCGEMMSQLCYVLLITSVVGNESTLLCVINHLCTGYQLCHDINLCCVTCFMSAQSIAMEIECSVFSGVELLALFNHPIDREGQLKYYTGKVPLRVQLRDEGVKGVEANWLDHMTQHFNNGASLVDGYFHLGNDNGKQTIQCPLHVFTRSTF